MVCMENFTMTIRCDLQITFTQGQREESFYFVFLISPDVFEGVVVLESGDFMYFLILAVGTLNTNFIMSSLGHAH